MFHAHNLRRAVHLMIALACSTPICFAQSTTIHILMIDGRNGHPWANKHINIYDASSDPRFGFKTLEEGKTDKDGVFVATLQSLSMISVSGGIRTQLCITSATAPKWRVSDVVANGAVQENNCNFKINAIAIPGDLVIFIRPESLKEFLD